MDDDPPDRFRRVNERVEVLNAGARWGREDKLRIVRELLAPHAVVSALAQRHEISTSLLYTWRKQILSYASSDSTKERRTAPNGGGGRAGMGQ